MNGPNSQFDKNSFGKHQQSDTTSSYHQNTNYEYVFSSGSNIHKQTPASQSGNGNGGRIVFAVLTVLLCAAISFVSGFGGALFANSFLNKANQGDNADIYNDNPASILEKAESSSSVYGSAGDEVFEVSQVVNKVKNAVVAIECMSFSSAGAGSGVIISETGYILTCHHVVDGATTISVTLETGSEYEATLVGSDATSDLAVICITPRADEPLTYVEQGCSTDLVVGEHVVAIGNPLGTLGGTVTDGIISATERTVQTTDGATMTLLQTNAAINQGNSGGGLFNLDGQLIGIVNAKYAASGVEGLAFAIPIDKAYTVELELIEYGYVRGVKDDGLTMMDITFPSTMSMIEIHYYRQLGILSSGVYVERSTICKDLQYCDRIIAVNGVEVNTTAELENAMEAYKIGDTVTIRASRNGTEFTTSITLEEYVPDYIKSNS